MVVLVTKTIINIQRIDFKHDAHLAVYHIQEQILTNDVALAGFSSLLANLDPSDLQETRYFTKYMRDAYPHIYMFEAMFRVDASQNCNTKRTCVLLATQTIRSLLTGQKRN